jgi:predicted lipoprotein
MVEETSMKRIVAVLTVLLMPFAAAAQNMMGMDQADMQKYMQMMQEMQACMEKVDQTKLDALEKRSEEFNAEIDALCAQGKRDEAQKKAIAFSREMADNATVQQIRQCTEKFVDMMPQEERSFMEDFDAAERHICDE